MLQPSSLHVWRTIIVWRVLQSWPQVKTEYSTCQRQDEALSGCVNPHLNLNVALNQGAADMRGCHILSSHLTGLSELFSRSPKPTLDEMCQRKLQHQDGILPDVCAVVKKDVPEKFFDSTVLHHNE